MSTTKQTHDESRLVTVCSECLRASCWQGMSFCDVAQWSSTVDKPISELRRLGYESPKFWEPGAGGTLFGDED